MGRFSETHTVFISSALWYCIYHIEEESRSTERLALPLWVLQEVICRVPCQIKTFATLPPSLRKGQLQARFMLWISALNCGCLNVPVLLSSNSSRNQHKGSNFLLTKLILTLSRISLRETDFCQVSSRIHRERINWLLHHALCWKMKK